MAIVAFWAIGVVAGCSSAPSIDDGSPAAAAAENESRESAIVTSTQVPAPASSPTLAELLTEDRFVPLAVALERSGLRDVIEGLDEFVLLAPTAQAFASSGADIGIEYSNLMTDARLLEAIMRYHVVAELSNNDSWRTLNGSALDVDGPDGVTIDRADGVEVLDQISVRNGTVLVMPRLLLPALDSPTSGTASQVDD